MEWKPIENESAFNEIQELSSEQKVLIFKHDSDSIVSFTMKQLLQREWNEAYMNMKTYLLNGKGDRKITEQISKEFGIDSDSPQVVIISKGKCIHTKANGYIQYKDLKEFANK